MQVCILGCPDTTINVCIPLQKAQLRRAKNVLNWQARRTFPHRRQQVLASLLLVLLPGVVLADDAQELSPERFSLGPVQQPIQQQQPRPGLLERGWQSAASAASAVMQFARQDSAAEPAIDSSTLSQDLRLEAFPALQAAEDTLRLLDVNHEPRMSVSGFSPAARPGLDLNTSYVWESPRFGQFVVSTSTRYVYNQPGTPGVLESSLGSVLGAGLESSALLPRADTAGIALTPERQTSLTFSWQIGNHTATAVTSYSGAMDQFGILSLDKLNADQLNELVGQITTLDLRYGYNVRAGRQGNASFSLGVRNMLDRRPQSAGFSAVSQTVQPSGSVAYGTVKYQF